MSRNKRLIDLLCGKFNIIFKTLKYVYRVEVSVKLLIYFWERIHKFRVNCLRDATDVGSAHSLLTRYFSSA